LCTFLTHPGINVVHIPHTPGYNRRYTLGYTSHTPRYTLGTPLTPRGINGAHTTP